MKILVTGAGGFIGRHVVDRLVAAGHEVVAVGRGVVRDDCRVIANRFDACDWSQVGGLDGLVHLAAINDTSIHDEVELLRVNVGAAIDSFESAVRCGCGRIVYASTLHVYGQIPAPMSVERSTPAPVSPYGRSKRVLEQAATELAGRRGVACLGLRLANVYGPGELHKGRMASQVLQIARQMRGGDPEVFAPGTQVRDFVFVEDVAAAIESAVTAAHPPELPVLNCGSGEGTSFNDLIGHLNAALGLARRPCYVPEPAGYLSRVILDIDATTAALAWRPRTIRAGIAGYLAAGDLR